MNATAARAALLELIRERAFRYCPESPFTLVSGAQSPFYFNCKAVTLLGEGLRLLGPVLFEELDHFPEARAAGGLTLGADPLAIALALHATRQGRPLDALIVRKEAKGHGTRQWLEGGGGEGAAVLILDDVVTTGGSTIQAIQRVHQAGRLVAGALVLVDRQECGGLDSIAAALDKVGARAPVRAVFQAREFLP